MLGITRRFGSKGFSCGKFLFQKRLIPQACICTPEKKIMSQSKDKIDLLENNLSERQISGNYLSGKKEKVEKTYPISETDREQIEGISDIVRQKIREGIAKIVKQKIDEEKTYPISETDREQIERITEIVKQKISENIARQAALVSFVTCINMCFLLLAVR